jgi:hypothetical protein
MGGGFTYLIMPPLDAMFLAFGLSSSLSWKLTLIVPFIICCIISVILLCFTSVSSLAIRSPSKDNIIEKSASEAIVNSVMAVENLLADGTVILLSSYYQTPARQVNQQF